ncbi:MAG TPA: cytochrome c biogenesis protein CcsA [Lacipirellulaceae bacterium]|jgi:ABC-type transport system involved in cytochrome c biogenesis permease subunit|nr:cytochrome c biogenesis protein CcsA [Lacipirellulaceae bacterium]
MATSDLAPPRGLLKSSEARSQATAARLTFTRVVSILASLRLTVTLFALSIILIFLGTLAQKDNDVWRVVNDTYFRVWFARVDFQVFERLAQLFFKSIEWNLTGGFYFFGGKTLGLALLVNLLSAHAIRFKISATGKRLYVGLATIVAGVLITYAVIRSGMNQGVESELTPVFCDYLWQGFRALLAAATLGGAYVLFYWGTAAYRKMIEWRVLLVLDVLLAILTVYLLAHPEARLDNSGIRILWQLVKGCAAGFALLAGCIMVFRKRAGIVLLHGGIALMMLTELFTAVAAVESQMPITDGATANYSSDIRTSELAVIDHSPADHDQVTVIPKNLLEANVGSSSRVDSPELPFTIQVHSWLENSDLRRATEKDSNPATAGLGKTEVAQPATAATGIGESSEKADFPSAYIELFSKTDGKSLGTYLVSQLFMDGNQQMIDQPVEVDGHKYDISLRFKRIYHPFSVTLKNFDLKHYVGTSTAKNYSSEVEFKDPRYNVDRDVSIWMNNPLRYSGTTFYQQSYNTDALGKPTGTILQVVTNPSWMTPYVACMLVGIGMLAHFGTMLFRFLRRRTDENETLVNGAAQPALPADNYRARKKMATTGGGGETASALAKWFPLAILLVFAAYIAGNARMPQSKPSEMQIFEFGKLPLVYEGRVKPYDTLARNTLQILSGRQELAAINDKGEIVSHQPAIRWLLDTISDAEGANDERVFRVENLDLLNTLGLSPRPQFWRYSYNEITAKKATDTSDPLIKSELDRQIKLANEMPEKQRLLYHTKVLELNRKKNLYTTIAMAFRPPPLSANSQQMAESLQEAQEVISELNKANAPHAVPPDATDTQWTILMQAEFEFIKSQVTKGALNPATPVLYSMLSGYRSGDVATFNKAVADYRQLLTKYQQSLDENRKQLLDSGVAKSEIMSLSKSNFEVFFNQFSPFYYAAVLYVFAFILGVFSWVGWTEPLRRASIWLLWLTFALHTFALVARVYISGRPPITNLYCTAIFIGWAGVLLSLIFESIQRLGLGNIVASVFGFTTLLLAYNLSLDGDTFMVLQAVLDTQFWLATHVVAINLGYAATYLAGAWGIAYIFCSYVFRVLDKDGSRVLLRALYGTLCFAIFFSFVGTVLGGLWADDSWGRFWGWDPKENGALMIVLWNALVLHARWGALVKGRGLAMLAVAGNIVTTWSYFGVNEYGVGLHAYGASESSTAMWLLTFAAIQVAVIALAAMPQHWFDRSESKTTPAG